MTAAGGGRERVPRIAPVPPTGNDAALQALLDDIAAHGAAGAMEWFRTLARAPGLLRRYRPFGAKLLHGSHLPGSIREIAILRTASRSCCHYELAHHRPLAAAEGLTALQVASAIDPAIDCPGWSPLELAVLAAADQLCSDCSVGDVAWRELSRHLDAQQLVELTILIGHYRMLAGAMNSLGVSSDGAAPPNVRDGSIRRDLPALTEETAFFWLGGADGQLHLLRCQTCGFYLHPPVPQCRRCASTDIRAEVVSGRGTVVSFTVNHQNWSAMPSPYTVIVVELDDQPGLRLTTNLADWTDVSPSVGLRVDVAFARYGEIHLPVFIPAPDALEARW